MSQRDRVTRFGLKNFKAFHYLEDIELKPLTLLVGANSSGKSSILQSLLLLKQTSIVGRSGAVLKFDGYLTNLGSYATVISDFDTSRTLEWRFSIEADVLPADLKQYFPTARVGDRNDGRPRTMLSQVCFRFGLSADAERPQLQQLIIDSRLDGMTDEEAAIIKLNGQEPRVKCQNLHTPAGIEVDLASVEDIELDRFWPASLRARVKVPVNVPPERWPTSNVPVGFFPAIARPISILYRLLVGSIEYLGPIRADPRPFYPVEEDPDLGPRGEGTIPFLLRHRDDKIKYSPTPGEEPREATLLEALNEWLRRMQVTPGLTIEPQEQVVYTAAVRSRSVANRPVNLAQVGFGVSQLLPVLVMGLKQSHDGWVLFEQPESQLHPRLQAELGDFLLSVAGAGKTLFVETHSDHLVNRIRRRIAEDETGTLSKLVQILFVHAGTDDNPSSYVEPLEVDESGTIVNCPPDFFPEAADEAFAILRARRRKSGRPPAP